MEWSILNTNVITSNRVLQKTDLCVKNGIIDEITKRPNHQYKVHIDGKDLLAIPGFINGHDHLLGSYLPRVGDRKPYKNWLEWDNDLKSSPIYTERQLIPSNYLYQLGTFRHLICGVTSVQDHIPHFVRKLFAQDDLPIKLINKYTLAHSICFFALPWGEGIEEEHTQAVENNLPFITHCSEGFDEDTKKAVEVLKEHNALSKHTVLIHGISFSDSDITLLKKYQTNVVLCPVSNLYMFNTTAPIQKLINNNINLCLGTDSPMSGSITLFQEIQVLKNYYQETYNEELPDKKIFEMLTKNPAKAFFLPNVGTLEVGNCADIVLIKGDPTQPYKSVCNIKYDDIMLVVVDGIPKYAAPEFSYLFDELNIEFQKIKVAGINRIIHGNILGLLNTIRQHVSFEKQLNFLPITS